MAYSYFTRSKNSAPSSKSKRSGIIKKLTEHSSSKICDYSDDDSNYTSYNCMLSGGLNNSCYRSSLKLTILSLFQESLNKLLNILNECESCFIYCIRSNSTKKEFLLDNQYFSVQLEYSGIFEGLTLLRNTYQNVFDFNEFVERFQLFIIDPNQPIRVIEDLNNVFEYYNFNPKTYFVGKTKVFLMDSACKKITQIGINMYTYCIERIELWWSTYSIVKKLRNIRKHIHILQNIAHIIIVKNQWKPKRKKSFMIDVDNINISLNKTIDNINDSHDLLNTLLERNEHYSNTSTAIIDPTLKKLVYTTNDSNFDNITYISTNYNDNSINNIGKTGSSENIEDVFGDEPINLINKPYVYINLPDSKSCIIDVDTFDQESYIMKDSLPRSRSHEKINMTAIDDECDIEDDILTHENITKSTTHPQTGTLSKSFRSILSYKKKSKSKTKSKTDKNSFINPHYGTKKKKFSKTMKSEQHASHKDSQQPSVSTTTSNTNNIIVNDHESFYIFIKYIQKYAFANQTTTSFNNPTDNLLSVFFTSLQRYTSINHAIFVNAFRFDEPVQITTDEAVTSFDDVLTKTINEQHSEFPINIGKNSFLGLLKLYKNATKNELHQLKKDFKRIRDSFDQNKSNITNEGHMMNCSTPLPGTNFCEVCNTLVWSDSYTCDYCQVVCHKRCIVKLSVMCSVNSTNSNNNKFYQVELDSLFSTQNTIPDKLISLLQEIEKRCLNTEGIYRRQCNMEKINNSRTILDNNCCQDIDFGQFEPLVLSSLVKLFFRQLPTPLFSRIISLELTNAGDITNDNEALHRINQILPKISKSNYLVLERILAHLAAIAENEQVNKMTSYNLAVIFAPCLFDFENTANITQLKFIDHQRRVIQLLIDTLGKEPPSDISYLINVDTTNI